MLMLPYGFIPVKWVQLVYSRFIVRRYPVGTVTVKNAQLYLIRAIYRRDDTFLTPDEIPNVVKARTGNLVCQPSAFPVSLNAAVGDGCLHLLRRPAGFPVLALELKPYPVRFLVQYLAFQFAGPFVVPRLRRKPFLPCPDAAARFLCDRPCRLLAH